MLTGKGMVYVIINVCGAFYIDILCRNFNFCVLLFIIVILKSSL